VHAKSSNAARDTGIARIAARQYGVISVDQLESLGIHRQGRATRIRAGLLHRIHRGVFAVGHPGLSTEGRWLAAVLACGPDAVLSHVSAARLWRLLPQPRARNGESLPPVHVTVTRDGRNRPGIRVHRSRTLDPSQTTRSEGIPVTTPSRTLTDLRRTLPQPQFAAALRQAEFLRLPIEDVPELDRTRSELEARFLGLCRRHRLPKPEVNSRIGPFVVDFAWPGRRLIVELDGYRAHGTRSAFEEDRERDLRLRRQGYEVVRLTWRQLADHRGAIASTLRRLLA
jgi:very-short-patch-repair endonuclease